MALERKDLVQDAATSTGTGAFVMAGTPAAGFQAFNIHTNGATFDYKAAAGAQWEVGVGTWNGSNIARSPTASSNANALVNFTTAPTVTEVVSAASVAAFLRASDGVDVSTLTAGNSINTGDSVLVLRNGTLITLLASLFASTNTTTPTQVITVNNPGPQTVGVTYTASGTYANGTPTALDFSVDGGTNWTAVPSPTIGSGNFSFSSTPSTPSASRQMMVRDRTTLVSGTSTAYVVSAASTQTISVATPGAQTVGTQFNVTGTWTVTQPSALDYRLSDDSAGVWAAAPAGVVINANGTYSFPLTPSTTSAGRAISVRDRATLVSGTSGNYVVNASVAQTNAQKYNVSAGPSFPTTATFSGGTAPNQYFTTGFTVYVKDSSNAYPAATDLKFAWSKDQVNCPVTFSAGAWGTSVPFTAGGGNSGNVPNSVKSSVYQNEPSYPGLFSVGASMYGGGTAGNFYIWVLFPDGTAKALGTPVAVS